MGVVENLRCLRIGPCRRTRSRPFREAPRLKAEGSQMKTWVLVTATPKRTRVVVSMGEKVVLRANLPPLSTVRNAWAATTLLEALSLWADERLCVALSAENV